MPQISVIVPVYKVESYLRRCVDSILAQTFTDFELILVDDGSPDNCPAMCDEYASKDWRVRVIHQSNQGQSAARNHAVAQAEGEWIAFVDSDDVIHPQMLEALYLAVKDSGADIAMCGAIKKAELPDSFFHPVTPAFDVSVVDESYHIALCQMPFRYWVVWGKLIRKQIVQKIPFTPGRVFEDSAVVGKWFGEARLAANTETPLYFYWINPNGTMKSMPLHKKMDSLWAMNEIAHYYASIHYEKMLQKTWSGYLMACVQIYDQAKKDFHDIKTADMIQRKIKQCMKDNRCDITLTRQQRNAVNRVLHPHISKLYLIPRSVLAVFKQGGAAALFKKAKEKLHKSDGSDT